MIIGNTLKSVWKFINFKKEPIYLIDMAYLILFFVILMVTISIIELI